MGIIAGEKLFREYVAIHLNTKGVSYSEGRSNDPNVFTYDFGHAAHLGTQASPRYGISR